MYLSFPISAPRRLLVDGDADDKRIGEELVIAINDFHHAALQSQRGRKRLAYISPLAVDELPLASSTEQAVKADKSEVDFDIFQQCWPVSDLWPEAELLAANRSRGEAFPIELADKVRGLVQTDVPWRDSRLALQSKCIAVFSPCVPQVGGPAQIARGVRTEILLAAKLDIPCFVYQDPRLDPTGTWEKWLGSRGSMGEDIVQKNVINVSSQDELFQRIEMKFANG